MNNSLEKPFPAEFTHDDDHKVSRLKFWLKLISRECSGKDLDAFQSIKEVNNKEITCNFTYYENNRAQ